MIPPALAEFFRFDLRYQVRSPLLWIGAGVFGLLAFGATASDAVQVGGAIGNVHRNAPVVIVQFMLVFSILGMLVLAASIAGALLRDFELGTAEMIFATPMRKAHYLFGRFSAAIVAALPLFGMIALGMLVGTRMPWLDPARIGPLSPWPYLWAIGVIVLPNLVLTGALLSLLAATSRSMLAVYIGLLGFITLWVIAGTLTRDIQNEWAASLLDPFGARAVSRTVRYWSAAEQNTLLPPLSGFLLWNRAVWTGVGLALLGAAYALFKPQRTGTGRGLFRRRRTAAAPSPGPADVAPRPAGSFARPRAEQRFGAAPSLARFVQQVRFDTLGVLRGVPFLVMLAFGVLNLVGGAFGISQLYGTKVYPVTYLMLDAMDGSYNFLLVLVVTFYAGELVWRERSAGLSEVTDAMPTPNWVPLFAKLVALVVVVLAFMTVGALTGMTFQLFKGGAPIEPVLYAKGILVGAIPFVLMGVLALALQVFANSKFIGYLAVILVMVLQLVLGVLEFDHNLYSYASGPQVVYSDMNGYGHFLVGRLWFASYWGFFASLLVAVAVLFWVRGTAADRRTRLRAARARLRRPAVAAIAVAALGFVGTGAWIFYNTNLVNSYIPGDESKDRRARYEKTYAKYKGIPQPRIAAVRADVDIYPDERSVAIRGHYRLVNRHDKPIPELHVLFPDRDAKVLELTFAPAEQTLDDPVLGYRIYRLKEPMAPGATMDFDFALRVAYKGFTNSGAATSLHENGTFFNNAEYFPGFGYSDDGQLVDRSDRRKRDLGEVPRMPKLEDEAARADNYIARDADWIEFETTVSTSPSQVALSPGYLVKEWTENGRRYFKYAMDAPMMPFFSYLSARWQVTRDSWKGMPIEIYHDPRHAYNVGRMIDGVKKSLDYFTTNFSPYQHRQVRILEFPRYATFAQSFANTIPFSESIGFIADLRDPEAIDYVFYVTAHEVAHQWWAHQVIGANVQGATVLSESLAQYSALMVMEKEYGREKMRRFLKYELDAYLAARGGELVEELPLYRVENQPYVHYRKGSLVFYLLRDEIGEEALNRALSRFLKDKGFQEPPYTTSRELLDYLRAEAPADKQAVITDLFEKIVFYDNRATGATARKRADGKYDVTIEYEARKFEADGRGAETPVPLDDTIEVGVFARAKGASEAKEQVQFLERRRVAEGKGTITVVVDGEPYEAGIDPYNKLIDRVSSDNRKTVSIP